MISVSNCAAILVAAGQSSRFGQEDKLLTEIAGAPLLFWSLKSLLHAGLPQIIVVAGENHGAVRPLVDAGRAKIIVNPDPEAGLGSSIATGAGAVNARSAAVFICLGDMPALPGGIFSQLAKRLNEDPQIDAIRPTHNGRRGHPVLFHTRNLAALKDLHGDKGASKLFHRHGFHLETMATAGDGVLQDVDTPADLNRIARRLSERH
ncbi:nucleotidyltransferase family protein [Hyphococcus sp.]|uniref:nucleotidyltransferase family protein n=1 Tax=Hyphococcus sp. TaxID=2038636 RepID=UPI003CCC2268